MNETDRELLELAAKAAGMVSYDPASGLMVWLPKPSSLKDSARWNARYASKTWNKDKWKATIRVHGKRISLGYFDSPEMASLAYQKAKAKFHPYYFNCKNAEALE